jgi:hypothetical protein
MNTISSKINQSDTQKERIQLAQKTLSGMQRSVLWWTRVGDSLFSTATTISMAQLNGIQKVIEPLGLRYQLYANGTKLRIDIYPKA